MSIAKEYPLYYPLAPASLKHLAATRIALDLWRCKGFVLVDSTILCSQFSSSELLQDTLPSSIRKLINDRIASVQKELGTLFSNFRELDIFTNLRDGASKCIDCIAYGPDGTVSIEATAKNLISSDKLNVFEKYMIARVYCFEEDIKNIWPSVFHNLYPNTNEAGKYPTMNYSSAGVAMNTNEASCSLYHCCNLIDCNNWTGLEYFLSNLGGTGKQCFALTRALLSYRFRPIKYILPKLNKAQAKWILRTHIDQIITVLATEEGYLEYIMKIWSYAKESISETKFFSLITMLAEFSFITSVQPRLPNEIMGTRMVLYEIWTNATDRLKNEFFTNYIGKFFHFLDKGNGELEKKQLEKLREFEDFHPGRKFFLQLITEMPVESRTEFWSKFWLMFVKLFRIEYFEKFVRLCLKPDHIKEFVENKMMNYELSKDYIRHLLISQSYDDTIEYLNFCLTMCDNRLVQEFRKKILADISKTQRFINFDKLTELHGFLGGMSNNIDEVNEAMRLIFFCPSVQELIESKLNENYAKEVICLTNRYLPTELDLREKELMWEHWIDFLSPDNGEKFDMRRWQEFLSWWQCKKEDLPMFKQFLPVDLVFEKLLLDAVPKLTLWLGPMELKRIEPVPSPTSKLEEFAEVDNFLMNHFDTEIDVKNYKWSKILNYQKLDGLKELLSMNNECIVNDILRWFFSGDIMEVGNFKDTLK